MVVNSYVTCITFSIHSNFRSKLTYFISLYLCRPSFYSHAKKTDYPSKNNGNMVINFDHPKYSSDKAKVAPRTILITRSHKVLVIKRQTSFIFYDWCMLVLLILDQRKSYDNAFLLYTLLFIPNLYLFNWT